ncbi:MAG: Hsp33 family molecular chaperone HslO [Spirochaetes bacterium]|nr:Hsp33 family molecular chaperone HslO [Spirochaetota bacterium]
METDLISRLICDALSLRAYTVVSLGAVREITSLHNTTPNATVALGRTLTAAALLGATLKPESSQSLLLKIEGNGPIREIHAQADARGNIRGYAANPHPDITGNIDKISFSRTIGAGFLTVRKDIGMREPYTSVIPLRSGEVAADVAYYLTVSEQIPSAVIIALTLEKDGSTSSSGGILIQTLPGTPEDSIITVENNIAAMSNSLGDCLKAGLDITTFIKDLFGGESVRLIGSNKLRAECRCSRNVIRDMLMSINPDELLDMLKKDKGAEVTCSFCSKKYHLNENDIGEILELKKAMRDHNDTGAEDLDFN